MYYVSWVIPYLPVNSCFFTHMLCQAHELWSDYHTCLQILSGHLSNESDIRVPTDPRLWPMFLVACREVNFVIHCAASIRFDQPIKDILLTNYVSTASLLELATQMAELKCFTYMSTAYVNSNQPRHSVIEEKIYPLPGTSNPFQVAQQLLALPTQKADRLVSKQSANLV